MRVGINAHLLAFTSNYRQAGLSRHIYELLLQLPPIRPQHDFAAFIGNSPVPETFSSEKAANLRLAFSRLPTVKAPVRIAWEQSVLPLASVRERLDLLHCPVNIRPFASPCPVIVTIHDLIFLRYPHAYRPAKRLYLKAMAGWSARHAAHVIAVSEATRSDVIALLRVPPERVTTVHNGVGTQFVPLPDEQVAHFKARTGIAGRIVLYVSTLEPRKNISMLLHAFRAIAEEPSLGDVTLVIGGSKGWYYNEIFSTAERLGLTQSGRVRFTGRVPDEELPLWYNAADLFVYPSLYEGFGLPVLEAMSCGTPVVASNTSSLPEVVGSAGVLLDPDNTPAWSKSVRELLADPVLARRLGEQARQQANKFSWERAARETAQIYDMVLSKRRAKYHRT